MTTLAGQLLLPTRDQIRDKWLRDYSLRNPGTDTTEGSLPYIDASVFADAAMPLYANARYITDSLAITSLSTDDLTTFGTTYGIPNPGGMPATGAVGYVVANTSIGGARIIGTDATSTSGTPALELRDTSGIRYNATITGTYVTGQLIPIAAVDTGAQTNQPVGVALTVTGTPYGLQQTLLVAASNGEGLTGGAPAESDADRAARFEAFLAMPPGAGNDAAYQTAIQSIPNLPVQAPFTWPAIEGPGTTGCAFTLQPVIGQSRCPSPAQVAIAAGQVGGQFPGDDGQFFLALDSVPVALVLGARWNKTAAPWADASPWPTPFTGGLFPFVSVNGDGQLQAVRVAYPLGASAATAPVVGQTIGLFNPADGTFRQKRILTVHGVSPGALAMNESIAWDLTFDATASDPSYATIGGQLVSPWSDSLAALAPPVIAYFQATGPGEVFSGAFDAGERRNRQPEPPLWPSAVDTPLLAPILELSQVASVTAISPALPHVCPVGNAPVYANLLELGDLAAYPI